MITLRCLQIVVARLVARIMGRAAARADADAAATEMQQHVALLQQRVERLGRMTGAMRARAVAGSGIVGGGEDTLLLQLVSAGVAVGCMAAGAAGAYLITRRTK